MKQLRDILHKVALVQVHGNTDLEVRDLQLDSRKVQPGSVFIAVPGVQADGHHFIDKAISLGAIAVICEILPPQLLDTVTYVEVRNSHEATGVMAHNFYDEPSTKLSLTGVTGTNGKTTTTYLIASIPEEAGELVAMTGTVEYRLGKERFKADRTTPEAPDMQRLLRRAVEIGCRTAVMECSSQAMDFHRCDELEYAVAIFANPLATEASVL